MFEATIGENEDRVVVGTYRTADEAYAALGRHAVALGKAEYAKVTDLDAPETPHEWAERISEGFTAETDAQWVLEQIEKNLWSGSAEDVRSALTIVLNSYFLALQS
jgi:hypothetical protein